MVLYLKALTSVDPFLLLSVRHLVTVALTVLWYLWRRRRRSRKREDEPNKTLPNREEPLVPSRLRTALFLVLMGSSMAVGDCIAFFCVRNMPLGDYKMIAASLPVFVAVFAWVFLKEKCDAFQVHCY